MSSPISDRHYRRATLDDLEQLLEIENSCFAIDRLSKRSFRHWIQADHGVLIVLESGAGLLAYGLLWCHKGTRLARLYSLAVRHEWQGQGLARQLLDSLELAAIEHNRLYVRLEVAKTNAAAIRLYEQAGYRIFGEYSDYYDDHSDAFRMQKTLYPPGIDQLQHTIPWYPQTTEFTCGPASLMMAMASLDTNLPLQQALELDLWREATTIFMTSGHGGCHPVGLGVAAQNRGYEASVFINTRQPLFVDGVRSPHKKDIMATVHQQFVARAQALQVKLNYEDLSQDKLMQLLKAGYAVVMLISTYRLDGKKAPHWVTVTRMDERCLYVHDPDHDAAHQRPIDCQHLPIARADFDKMSSFGAGKLRTAVAIKRK